MTTYILVDYANLVHRCKHAIPGDVSLKTGMAMQTALNSFRKMWKMFDGSHIVVCLEGGSWRKSFYSKYKANRIVNDALKSKREIEDDAFYFEAMNQFADFLDQKTNVTVIKEKGIEADDIIARWIDLHPDSKHVILSGDTDFYQLLADNVSIYDGVKEQTITITSVTDSDGNPSTHTRNVKKKDPRSGKTVTKKEVTLIQPPDPDYELFKKIIRGDSTDNIMSAYPGAREKGTSTKPGIIDAFNDRVRKGYDWNSFMLAEWDKVEMDTDGETITKRVRVIDEFNFNNLLINLRAQPDDIKEKIDSAILTAVQKPEVKSVGIRLMQFCESMDLVNIGRNPNEYAKILTSRYE